MIRVDKDIIIDVDGENYVAKVEKHKLDKKGVPVTDLIGYYTSLENALEGTYRYKVAKSLDENEYTLHEAVRVVVEAKNELKDALDKSIGGF